MIDSIDGLEELEALFSDDHLLGAINRLNANAATGLQGIPSWVLKKVFKNDQAQSALLILMNQCWNTSTIPFDWAFSELFVLFKGKSDELNVNNNYRGINL